MFLYVWRRRVQYALSDCGGLRWFDLSSCPFVPKSDRTEGFLSFLKDFLKIQLRPILPMKTIACQFQPFSKFRFWSAGIAVPNFFPNLVTAIRRSLWFIICICVQAVAQRSHRSFHFTDFYRQNLFYKLLDSFRKFGAAILIWGSHIRPIFYKLMRPAPLPTCKLVLAMIDLLGRAWAFHTFAALVASGWKTISATLLLWATGV